MSTPNPIRSISVLMPTFNGEAFLGRVMAALSTQRIALPWDFLAIDSGSTDATLAILRDWQARFPVELRIEHIHPTAFNHGDTRNLLAAQSGGDLLVFLTQDAIPVGDHWLARLVRNFDDPRVAAAYCRNVPRPDAEILTRLFSEHDPGYAAGRREQQMPAESVYATMNPHEKRLLFNLNDVAAAYRRGLWELHPFPRAQFGEDVLMARALIEGDYTVVYDEEAVVEHSHDYDPPEMRRRAFIDGKFNVEWLDRVCVATSADAETLTGRQLELDRAGLRAAGINGGELEAQMTRAAQLRNAAFAGLYEGGLSTRRHPVTRMLDKTRLRVLYVVHGFPPDTWAGTEVYTLGLAREMQRRGHDVAILARSPGGDDAGTEFSIRPTEFQGLPVWRMTNPLEHRTLRDSYFHEKAEAAFRHFLLEMEPDVVHFQHLIHMSASLPQVCRELGIPSLITINDYWALCARVQLIRPDGVVCDQNQGLGCLVCVKNGNYKLIPAAKRVLPVLKPFVPVLSSLGTSTRFKGLARRADEYRDIAGRHDFVCAGYAAADLAIAPSRFLRAKLLETGKFDEERMLYSDYGTLTDNFRPIDKQRAPDGRIRFGYVGSLLSYKGVDVLVRAIANLPRGAAVLHVFGDYRPDHDPYHARLEELARAASDDIVFHGRFDNQHIANIYQQIDVLVVPSTWFENSPITIHEAFLFRTPVVTSNIGGMAELVTDGQDGLHFNVGDADDLARKLERFVREPGLLETLSNFRHIKTMVEDAREMEARYRALACIVRDTGPKKLVDRTGWSFVARGGPVEPQGGDLALLRPGGWAEYDVSVVAPGRIAVRVAIQALAAEREVPLGGTVSIDGREVGRIDQFTSRGRHELFDFQFEAVITRPVRRIRIDTRNGDEQLYLRIARLVVMECVPAAPGIEA